MKTTHCDVAVVGAGPAGLSAALRAAEAGAKVVVVDEYAKPGGQYFRQPQARFTKIDERVLGKSFRAGRSLLEAVGRETRIDLRTGTLVWGAFDDGVLELESRDACERLVGQRIVVATGAYERPIPFRGWTLPGVMTAGAAQATLKAQFVLPGRRVLMSGTGPFQLPVATQLSVAGAKIVEILECRRATEFFRPFPRPWRHLDKLIEAQGYFAALVARRIPLVYGETVVEACGDGAVEEAVVAPVGPDGRTDLSKTRRVAVDAILTNFGFVPGLQLARLLGCATVWDEPGACWVAECDDDQRSSKEGILLAGEVTGIAGHRVAMAEGEVAGLRAATDLGLLSQEAFDRQAHEPKRRRARHQEFADHLKRSFSPLPGLYACIPEDTVVCRCEEVVAERVRALAKEWDGSLRAVKQCTRAGMGQCQGRICEPTVARLAALATGRPVGDIGRDTARPQIKPVTLRALAEPISDVS